MTALPEKEKVFFLLDYTYNKHWDKCSWFLCLPEKTGSGRTGPYNVQLTVVNNNNKNNIFYIRMQLWTHVLQFNDNVYFLSYHETYL